MHSLENSHAIVRKHAPGPGVAQICKPVPAKYRGMGPYVSIEESAYMSVNEELAHPSEAPGKIKMLLILYIAFPLHRLLGIY